MESWILFLILLLGIYTTLAGGFQVTCAPRPIVIAVGATAVLECQLTPSAPLEGMEIRWTKSNALVHLYRFGLHENDGQDARYQGRTELFDAEFKSGNVSLMLKKVELLDEGAYKCFVETPTLVSQDAVISLEAASLGQPPAVNLFKYTGSGIQLLCDSRQWFPAPTVEWRDREGKALAPADKVAAEQNPKLFFKVRSFIDVTSDSGNTFTCLLRNERLNKTLRAEFHVPAEFFPTTSGWLYAFLLIFFSVFALLAGLFVLFRKQQQYVKDLEKRPPIDGFEEVVANRKKLAAELENHLDDLAKIRRLSKKAIQRITSVAVPVTLDCETANPNLKVSPDLTSVSYSAEAKIPSDNGKRFESRLSVLGKDGFTTGRHYWEVAVGSKSDWDLGVAGELVARVGQSPLNPANGYWTIGRDRMGHRANDDTPLRISLRGKFPKIGIYVNYEAGTVVFCDAANHSHLHTFAGGFKGKIYPFFNLAQSGEALKICAVLPSS